MQKQTSKKTYIYNANAIGIAGQITHPFNEIIPIQAASALPPDGGVGSIRVEGFRHRDILSFASAYAEVVGTEPESGVYETLSVSVVEKFNLLDVVTCDRIVGRLTSRFPGVAKDGCEAPREVSVVPIGSRFEGLRIGNHFFERLELAPDYFCAPERAFWTGLLKAAEYDRDGGLSVLTLPAANGDPVPLPTVEQRATLLGFSIAVRDPKPGAELGHPIRIKVPQFGTVHLGEFFCSPTSRSLTMLRVELGCSVGGNANVAAIQGGGRPYP